jgi:hypothetical protein
MCVDETMMQWLMATMDGRKPNITQVGLSYMLLGEARQGQGEAPAKDPTQVKQWFYTGPHIMIALPDEAAEALKGMNQDLSNNLPYSTFLSASPGATPLLIVPVARGGYTIKEEPAQ